MHILSVIALFELLGISSVAVLVFRQKPHDSKTRLFTAMLASLAVWLFGGMFAYSAASIEQAVFWFKVCSPGFLFLHAFTLHFALEFCGHGLAQRRLVLLLYLPSVIFTLVSFQRLIVFETFFRLDTSWVGIPAYSDPYFYLILVHYLSYYSVAIALLLRFRSTQSVRWKRRQVTMVVGSIAVTVLLFNLEPFMVPLFTGGGTYILSPLFSIVWVLGIIVAIRRYHFLEVFPLGIQDQILQNLDRFILYFDSDLALEFANTPARTWFLLERRSNKSAPELFHSPVIHRKLRHLGTGKPDVIHFDYLAPGAGSELSCAISKVRDGHGDIVGYLLQCDEISHTEEPLCCYDLSKREHEVAALVHEGLSNKGIAETLCISEFTVKSHLSHIFTKCGLDNRQELAHLWDKLSRQ